MANYVRAASIDDIPEGRAVVVDIDGESLALGVSMALSSASITYARMTGAPLGEGELDGTAIECPDTAADLTFVRGRALSFPAVVPVNAYDVKIEGQDILVDLE